MDQGRLDMAAKLGADQTILVDTRDVQEMVKRIHTALGEEPDITIECTGAPPAVQTGIFVSFHLTYKIFVVIFKQFKGEVQ